MPSSLDRYLQTALDVLARRHALDVIERIGPGEIGCCSCGHIAPVVTFPRQPRGGRRCPACGVDVDREGYVCGDELVRQQSA